MKLFKVETRMNSRMGIGPNYGMFYVSAKDADSAYRKVRWFLEEADLGCSENREMTTVTLLAEDTRYPDCQHIFLSGETEET